jgi:hypothetical protein
VVSGQWSVGSGQWSVGAEFSGVERWIAGSPIRTPDTRKDSLAHALCCLLPAAWQLATGNWQLATGN